MKEFDDLEDKIEDLTSKIKNEREKRLTTTERISELKMNIQQKENIIKNKR